MNSNSSNSKADFLQNPLIGLAPLVTICIFQVLLGLDISLYIAVFLSLAILIRNYFTSACSFQIILLFNLVLVLLFLFFSINTEIIPDSFLVQSLIVHLMLMFSIIMTLIMRAPLFRFFKKQYAGYDKLVECSFREFYFISFCLLGLLFLNLIILVLAFFIPLLETQVVPVADFIQVVLVIALSVMAVYRRNKIATMLAEEEYWPVVNTTGAVVGKIARSVSLTPSKQKHLHPVVRVHFISGGCGYLFKKKGDDYWDCPISDHMLFGESMDETIARVAQERFGWNDLDLKPRFLLKHIVEECAEKQYILLYYTSDIHEVSLINPDEGEIKCWPIGQIENNLGKNIFTDTFETEYEYFENTVLMVNRFGDGKDNSN